MAVKIFTQLIAEDTGSMSSKISEGLFTNGVGTLTAFYTSSAQVSASGMYNIDVYQEATSSATSEVQFSISYGHVLGSGSTNTNDEKPTRAVYAQYRNLLLEPNDSKFTFNGVDSNHIVVFNIKRALFKENIDPGNWQLTLATGSTTLVLTDDSLQSLGAGNVSNVSAAGKKFYNIVSGTIATGPSGSTSASYAYYGLLYHELGLLVLNGDALRGSFGATVLATGSTTPSPTNNEKVLGLIVSGANFQARNEETLNSQHYFVRIKSKEYNFSNNPTYVTGSQGRIIDSINKRGVPFSYVTGIGLYNDQNELLATAKLSQPVFKEPGTEALIKVRLDFVWLIGLLPLAHSILHSVLA